MKYNILIVAPDCYMILFYLYLDFVTKIEVDTYCKKFKSLYYYHDDLFRVNRKD